MTADVSVLITNYNKREFIGETLSSVFSQSFENYEVIIVDDCSTDASVEVINSCIKSKQNVQFICNDRNMGANYCRNKSIGLAKGKYLIFLDSDDLLTNDCLHNRLQKAQQHPDADLIVFTMGVFYKTIGDDGRLWLPTSKTPLEDFLLHSLPWSILQPFWKREFMLKIGGFDEKFKRLQDVEMHTRALLAPGFKYVLVPGTPDCYYRIDDKRNVYSKIDFLDNWVNATIQYCDKFLHLAPDKANLLRGSIFQMYVSLLFYLKRKEISREQFVTLEQKLVSHTLVQGLSVIKKGIFSITKIYNLMAIRVPGANRIMKKLVTS